MRGGPRRYTFYQSNKECAAGRALAALMSSLVASLPRPGLTVGEAIIELGSLRAMRIKILKQQRRVGKVPIRSQVYVITDYLNEHQG